MSSNIKISGSTLDLRSQTSGGTTTFDDDPANTGGAANPSELSTSDLNAALASGNVNITTQSSNEVEAGDVEFSTALTYTNTLPRLLSLNAANDILLDADIGPGLGASALSLQFIANSGAPNPNGFASDVPSGSGGVKMAAGITINSNGGDISFSSSTTGRNSLQSVITSGGGTVTINGGSLLAGALTVSSAGGTINLSGAVDGAHDLSLDAGAGIVNLTSMLFGAVTPPTGLAIAAGTLTTNSVLGTVDALAVDLTGANSSLTWTNGGNLTIGTVGAVSGILTNTGNVNVTVSSGNLTVASAIKATGLAAANGPQVGSVTLTTTAPSATLSTSAAITGNGVSLSANNGGTLTVGATVDAGSGNLSLLGGQIYLGADLKTDGAAVSLTGSTRLTTATVTIDTDQTVGGAAGSASFGSVDGSSAGTSTLIVDARESGLGAGAGGAVSFGGFIGANFALAGLGIGAASASFIQASNNNVGTLALNLTGANAGVSFLNAAGLTIGAVGAFTGITTNTGNVHVTVSSGNLTVASAIKATGVAATNGLQVGSVTLATSTAAATLSTAEAITGNGVSLSANNGGTLMVGAAIDAGSGNLSLLGTQLYLGADLTTDGAAVSLTGSTRLTTATVIIDTDQTVGGTPAGNVSLGAVDGSSAGTSTLIIDARESGLGAGGAVSFSGFIGSGFALAGLGIEAASASFIQTSNNNVGTLALNLTGANAGVSFLNAAGLTIGTVGAFDGITTNTGNVFVSTAGGGLTVASAINTAGVAPPNFSVNPIQVGSVRLDSNGGGGMTISAPITGTGVTLNLSGGGVLTISADINARTGSLNLSAAAAIGLGADLTTDGSSISTSSLLITAPTVVIDSDQTAGGNAGTITIGSIDGGNAGANTLIVDARETAPGPGTDGVVTIFGPVGSSTPLAALGIAGLGVSPLTGANNVGTLAVNLSGANSALTYFNAGALTIGSVGGISGLRTNTGNILVSANSGSLTVSSAISTVGTATPSFPQVGSVTLQANGSSGALTVAAPITGTGVTLTTSGLLTLNGAIDARSGQLNLSGSSGVSLGVNLQTDGGVISAGNDTLAATTVRVDSAQTAGANAGNIAFGTINGTTADANTLIVDARATGGGTSGTVGFNTIGATPATRLAALGIGAAGLNSIISGNVSTIAINLDGVNRSVFASDQSALTIGTVGPFSGITTNTGNVTVSGSGALTVSSAVNTVGTAPPDVLNNQFGSVQLSGSGGLTTSASITGTGVQLTASGSTITIGALVDARAGNLTLSASTINLGANLQTDGGSISVLGSLVLTPSSVTIDSGQTAGGTAGNITFNAIEGTAVGSQTLIVDARETSGVAGNVVFNTAVGQTTPLAGLGIGGANVFLNGSGYNVGTLAINSTGANGRINYLGSSALTIGTVGPFSGITTNTGNVAITTLNGDVTISSAINAIGTASAGTTGFGFQTGAVSITANGFPSSIWVNAPITGNGIGLGAGTTLDVAAALNSIGGGLISLSASTVRLGVNLTTDSGAVTVSSSALLTAASVTVDTDQTPGGSGAGNVTFGAVNGDGVIAAPSLLVDASDSAGAAGGAVSFNGLIGMSAALSALGVRGASANFANGNTSNVGTLAVNLTGSNAGVTFMNVGNLAIGTVGTASGITTNTGNVQIIALGTLAATQAISAVGGAAPQGSQIGGASLTSTGVMSVVAVTGNGVNLNTNGNALTIGGTIDGGTSGIILSDSVTNLGGDLLTDGANITAGALILTAGTVTVDTDRTGGGSAGNVTFGSVNGATANANTLIVDAHETAGGTGGIVTFNGQIGGVTALAGLGVSGSRVDFASSLITAHDVGTLAVKVTGANQNISFADINTLIIGTVGDIVGLTATGSISVDTGGMLTVSDAISGNGVGLSAGPLTALYVNAAIDAHAGSLTLSGSPIYLGANLQTDGGAINIGAISLTAPSVIIDSRQLSPVDAGNISTGSILGTSANSLVLDARGGAGGFVTISGTIGVGGLGAAGRSVSFQSGISPTDVDVLAVNVTGANESVVFNDPNSLIVGTVGAISGISAPGSVSLGAQSDLTVDAAISGGSIGLNSFAGTISINATLTSQSTVSVTANANLGADISADGDVDLSSIVVTAPLVTIDSDRTAGGTTGHISVFSVGGQPSGSNTLVLDARATDAGASGSVLINGLVAPIGGLGIGGSDLTLGSNTTSIGTLAINLDGLGAGVSLTNTGALAIGTVGTISGVTTNGGSISLATAAGPLTVAGVVSGLGVTLSAAGALTVNNASVNSGTAALSLSGSALALSGLLQTDGATATLTGPLTINGPSLTIDTNTASPGAAGDVTITGSVNGTIAGTNTLIIDASRADGLPGGTVTLGAVGVTTALGGLGIAANAINFGGAVNAGTMAFNVTGANAGINFSSAANLAIGSLGSVSGITTNTGNVSLTSSGTLTVSRAINTTGAASAAGGQTGAVLLSGNGVTLSGPNGSVTTPGTYTVNAGTGAYTQDASTSVNATGSILVTATDVVLNGSLTAGSADVTLRAAGASETIGIADASESFSLTDAELDRVSTPGLITIGSVSNTGGITIGTDAALTQNAKDFQFTTGGTIAFSAHGFTTTGSVGMSANAVTTGAGVLTAGDLTATTVTGLALNTAVQSLSLNNTTSGNVAVINSGAVSVTGSNTSGRFDVTADAALTVGGALTAASATLTGTSVTLNGAATVAGTLELDATSGGVTQTAVLSAGTLAGSATGAITLTALNTITTLGALTANGLRIVDAAGGLTASGAADGGSGATAITTTGNLAINGTVSGTGVTLTANTGAIQLGADVNARSAVAAFQNSVTLTHDATVSGDGGITFGAINGTFGLETSSTATTTFGGAVGGITTLSFLNATSATIALNGGVVTTMGAQTYTGAVTLGANTTLTGTTPTFSSAVTGNGHDLAFDFSGTTDLSGGNVTGIKNLSAGNGGTTLLGGTLTTSGTQSFSDAVQLSASAIVTSTGVGALGDVTFSGTVGAASAGVQSLTVNSSGTTTFAAAIGATKALAALTTDAAGATVLDGLSVTTTGSQTYNDAVTLGGDVSFTSIANGAIAFNSTVHTDSLLSISTAGMATFAGILSGLGGLTTGGGGIVTLQATNTYGGATTVGAGTLLVDGSIATSSGVTVQSGGTLGGSGTTSGVTVETGGILAAGHSPGILHTGALDLQTGSTLQVEIGGASAGSGYDEIDVTGSVTIGGATLSASLIAPFQLANGNTIIIVNNDGSDAVNGTFDGLAEGAMFSSGGSTYQISYIGGSGNDVTLTALNDAPVLTAASPVLNIISEDDVANPGQLVSDFRGSANDTDPSTDLGIAVTSASSTNGHWQYQLTGSGTWVDFGIVDTSNSLLLRDTDRVRFLPDAANGTTATLTYRAWDQTFGASGQKTDTTVNGSITAFSTTENAASLTVTSVNDAPALSINGGAILNEGASATLGASSLAFIDVDAGSVITYTLTAKPARGTLFKSGVALAPGNTFTPQDIAAGLISYTHDGGETTADAFGFSVSDGIAPSITGQTFAFTINPVNDAPVLRGTLGFNVREGGAATITTATVSATDSDNSSAQLVYTVLAQSHGTVLRNGVATTTFTQFDLANKLVSFQHDGGEADGSVLVSLTDGSAAPQTATIAATVNPHVDDAPVINGDKAIAVSEGGLVRLTVADLTAVDADTANAQLVYTVTAQTHGTVLRDGVATRSFNQVELAGGHIWFRHDGGEAAGSFAISLSDGRAAPVTATVTATVNPHVNDAPVLGGDGAITVAEGGSVRLTTADLTATDPDNTSAQLVYTVIGRTHGDIRVSGGARTTFTQADLVAGRVTFVHDGSELDGSFRVSLSDGTARPLTKVVTATVNPHVDDAPVFDSNPGARNPAIFVPENRTGITSVHAHDVDSTKLTYSIVGGADGGAFRIDSKTGLLSFINAPDFEARGDADHNNVYVVQVGVSDGTLTTRQMFNVNLTNVNEAPVIRSNGGGALASISMAEGTKAVTTVQATDIDSSSLTYGLTGGADRQLFQIDPRTGTLSFVSTPAASQPTDADHNNVYQVQVGVSDGSLSDTQTVAVQVTPHPGTPGDDSFAAGTGNQRIDAGLGHDTIAFAFKLTDANISFSGNQVSVDTATSHTVLTGFETYVFADGVVNENDGDPLVDDLYYYSQNHDVWIAHGDADQHYHTTGWKEGRNPNAFFDTKTYLAINPDVKAAGVDPLVQYDQSGWQKGNDPSLTFDTNGYLKANPDIAAAHVDPLLHFLAYGAQEGRQPVAPTSILASNGFDYLYYLQHNPDVAAAGIDPLAHYETVGWKEGRNPNALFDDSGYLAHYPDVAAANVSPLDHYHESGWKEGRDPSVNFDTTSYLAAYADVAAGNTDPLLHYLAFGIHEGRSPFADGVWW